MFNGLEIDMLALGDADCIVVTHWGHLGAQRVLIDGGNASDIPAIKEFLRSKSMTNFWAVVCTHLHNDHARGLIKLVEDQSITIHTAWMHDIRKHIAPDVLRRASSGNSSQADGVKEIWENTKDLAGAFARRGLSPQEPFAGLKIADYPLLKILGPSLPFYQQVLREFTKVEVPSFTPPPVSFLETLSAIGGTAPRARYGTLRDMLDPSPETMYGIVPPAPAYGSLLSTLAGVLENSSVKKNPETQPFNNTSAILGIIFNGQRLMLTGDAGSAALDAIPPEWKQLLWMQVPHHGSEGNLSQSNIERFCPKFAYVSARGDMSHPSKAIVNGLIKVGSQVFSTHSQSLPGHLWFHEGTVPARMGYGPAISLKGIAEPVFDPNWLSGLSARRAF